MSGNLFSKPKVWNVLRVIAAGSLALTWIVTHPPQPVAAAADMSVVPIAWNTIGLDSNNVSVGPNHFPVGATVCNTGDVTLTNVTSQFVFDSANIYIDLRPLTAATLPVTGSLSLGAGECHDFYYEVEVTRDASAYDTTREYHITADSDQTSVFSTPQPRQLYVEHLVSQHRNQVLDVKLNGASVPINGTMNLTLGNSYDVTLISKTSPEGYEQVESFLNFLNTVFRLDGVSASYSYDDGTDPYAGQRLYANGCNWDADPGSATYRTCLDTGKYGGTLTITYSITVIGGAGSNQSLSTLIYDFSGSSYHYNDDFPSTRFAQINDPSACEQLPIAAWDFAGSDTTPSTDNAIGTPVITAANVTGPDFLAGNPDPGIAYGSWPGTLDTESYVQVALSTEGYYAVHVTYDQANDAVTGPQGLNFYHAADGTTFTQDGPAEIVSNPSGGPPAPTWTSALHDLSPVAALDNDANAAFRLSAYGGVNNADFHLLLDNISVSGCALPAGIGLSKSGSVDQTVVPPSDQTNVGDQINYSIIITNTGGTSLGGILLSDSLAGSITCNPALAGLTLQPGESTTCDATYTLQASDFTADPPEVQNCATADSRETDPPVQACHTEVLTPPTEGEPTLSIAKTANTSSVTRGGTITFTIMIDHTQASSGDAANVEVTDVLPPGLEYVSGPVCDLGSQVPDVACNYDSSTRTVQAAWSNFSRDGGPGQISFVARGGWNLECGSSVMNRADVRWDGGTAQASLTVMGPVRGQDGCPVRLPRSGFMPGAGMSKAQVPAASYNTNLGMTLDIPRMGITGMEIVGVPLQGGNWDVSALGNDAGWLEGAAAPGQSGNSVITAHVTNIYGQDGPFATLETLSVGDRILVTSAAATYEYQVQLSRVVMPDDTSIFDDGNGLPVLTLVTCSDPNYDTHTYDARLVVQAVMIGQVAQQ